MDKIFYITFKKYQIQAIPEHNNNVCRHTKKNKNNTNKYTSVQFVIENLEYYNAN